MCDSGDSIQSSSASVPNIGDVAVETVPNSTTKCLATVDDAKCDNDVAMVTEKKSMESNVNANNSDQESETEQRNTSTSNAGESEYESANEEDIDDFENTPSTEVTLLPSNKTVISSNNVITNDLNADKANITENVDELEKDSNKLENGIETNEEFLNNKQQQKSVDYSSNNEDEEEENYGDEVENLADQNVQITKQGENDEEFDEYSDEEDDDDIDDEEEVEEFIDDDDTFDEADEGLIIDSKSIEDLTNKLSIEDERENGDGQESENIDSKSLKAAQAGNKSVKKSEVEDKRNPQYIPRKGPFYEHDDRNDDQDDKVNSTPETADADNKVDDNDSEKNKPKKRLVASMKLRSDEMIDDENDLDQTSTKSVSKEKLHDLSNAHITDGIDKVTNNIKVDSKSPRDVKKPKPIWDSKDRWSHDKFNVDDQKPKSREELINSYGYDIRNENEAPKSLRRSKYGKGPTKYARRSEDENAYAKKALRKVIARPSQQKNSSISKQDIVRESRNSQSPVNLQPIGKKDVNYQYLDGKPKEIRKSFSKEVQHSSRFNNSRSSNNTDTASRGYDRVFVNKSKLENKSDRSRSSYNNQERDISRLQHIESNDIRKDNKVVEVEPTDRSKELFTNDDFPELSSSAKKSSAIAIDSGKKNKTSPPPPLQQQHDSIIYYGTQQQQPNMKPIKEVHHPSMVEPKDNNGVDSDSLPSKPNQQTSQMIKGQLNDNVRYSKNRNYPIESRDYHNSNNWNNRSLSGGGGGKLVPPFGANVNQPQQQQQQQPSTKKQPPTVVNTIVKEDMNSNNHESKESLSNDTRPKRYSSIRQQRTIQIPSNQGHVVQSPINNIQQQQFVSVTKSNVTMPPQQYMGMNSTSAKANIVPPEITSNKSSYYDPVSANDQSGNMLPNAVSHVHAGHGHNYPSNTGTNAGGAAAYMPTPAPMMAYYDPNGATGPNSGTTTTALPAPLGITQAYYTTDQTGTHQPTPNYYLTTADLTAVAYHPAFHLQANYTPTLASHQAHVANRYLNTTPTNAGSAESNRYLQTAPPTPNSAQILVAGQPYPPPMQAAFPAGYPQFPTAAAASANTTQAVAAAGALGTSSPLPAGYPSVPIVSSTSNSTVVSTPQQTPSGYPELYRGGITYYDIQSQQQAMQRHLQHNITSQPQQQQPAPTRKPKTADNVDNSGVEGNDNSSGNAGPNQKAPSNASNEISVSN